MSAEPRDVEEIRGDLVKIEAAPSATLLNEPAASMRLLRDVEPLLARLAAADRENAELRGEVERLRRVWPDFTSRIEMGDDRTEPAATVDDVARIWEETRAVLADHEDANGCSTWCDNCGWWEQPRSCPRCFGGGMIAGPSECPECGGDGTNHVEWTLTGDKPITDLRAQLAAAERDRDEARSERDDAGLLWGRHYNDAMGALETQLAAAQAQLAEANGRNEQLRALLAASENAASTTYAKRVNERYAQARVANGVLRAQLETAQAQLASTRCQHGRTEAHTYKSADPSATADEIWRGCPGPALKNAALSAAPQPEPETCPCATPGGALYLDNLRRLSPSRRTIAAAEAACTCGQHRLTWPEPPASDEPTGRSD